jgi:glycosyltransferase involved in cell wall biosynthesis
VVVTRVGGLPEAAQGYGGAIFVPPGDAQALETAIWQGVRLAGRRFADPRSWGESIEAILSAADPRPAPPVRTNQRA